MKLLLLLSVALNPGSAAIHRPLVLLPRAVQVALEIGHGLSKGLGDELLRVVLPLRHRRQKRRRVFDLERRQRRGQRRRRRSLQQRQRVRRLRPLRLQRPLVGLAAFPDLVFTLLLPEPHQGLERLPLLPTLLPEVLEPLQGLS